MPLGYYVKDKRLIVNTPEAKTVSPIFERYLALGSFQKLIAELDAKGVATKERAQSHRWDPLHLWSPRLPAQESDLCW